MRNINFIKTTFMKTLEIWRNNLFFCIYMKYYVIIDLKESTAQVNHQVIPEVQESPGWTHFTSKN